MYVDDLNAMSFTPRGLYIDEAERQHVKDVQCAALHDQPILTRHLMNTGTTTAATITVDGFICRHNLALCTVQYILGAHLIPLQAATCRLPLSSMSASMLGITSLARRVFTIASARLRVSRLKRKLAFQLYCQ